MAQVEGIEIGDSGGTITDNLEVRAESAPSSTKEASEPSEMPTNKTNIDLGSLLPKAVPALAVVLGGAAFLSKNNKLNLSSGLLLWGAGLAAFNWKEVSTDIYQGISSGTTFKDKFWNVAENLYRKGTPHTEAACEVEL